MKRAVLALLVLSAPALAGWRLLGAPGGTLQDLTVADGGWVVAVGTAGVTQYVGGADGGIATGTVAGAYRSAVSFSNGCLALVSGTALSFSPAGCGTPRGTIVAAPISWIRTWNGDQLVVASVSGSLAQLSYGSPDSGANFIAPTAATWPVGGVFFLRSAHLNGADFVAANGLVSNFQLSIDGGTRNSIVTPAALTDLSIFDLAGSPALIGVTTGATVVHPDIASTPTVTPTIPAGFTPARIAMGSLQGMLLSNDGRAASPVPNPAAVARTFRLRPDAGVYFGGLVDCATTRFCAASDTSNQAWLYENTSAPTAFVAPASGAPGAVITLAVDAGDGDGDPLFHTWSTTAAFTPTPGWEDGTSIDLTLPATCGVVPVTVNSTDGLFTTPTTVNVAVTGHGTLGVQPSTQTLVAGAGGAGATFTAVIDGGCDTATFSWLTSDGRSGTGSTFTVPEPATWCQPPTVNVTLTATWNQGTPVTSTAASTLTITPWGVPDVPVFAPAQQPALTTRLWTPTDLGHACEGLAGFPGTQLLWSSIDAGPATVTALDGGLLVVTPELCTASQVTATARREVTGEALGRVSNPAAVTIDLLPGFTPLDLNANFTLGVDAGSGLVVLETDVTASCLPQRSLGTEVTIFDGPTAVAGPTFMPTPGLQAFAVPGGCAGGARDVVARLFEDGGFTGATRQATVTFPAAQVAIGAVTPSRLVAQCGAGATGHVELTIPAGACASAEVSWRSVGGPALAVTSGSGTGADLATVETGFESVGQQVVLEWSVDAGAGNALSEQRTIEIGVEPFVTVSTRTLPLLAREESARDLELTLTNTMPCAADGLEVIVPLTQGTPLEGSVIVDGARVPSEVVDGALVLSNVHLDASGRATVKFSARPRLLAAPIATAEVRLRGNVVSMASADAVAPSGCGCASIDAGTALLFAALLVARRRFRRN